MRMPLAIFVASIFLTPHAWAHTTNDASSCINDPSWIEPQKPFRVFGNTWHVGPRGLGVFLITSPTGHVLIDGGVPGHAAMIEANVRSLGFQMRDIRWILNSHAHCDHAGGIAQLIHATKAELIAAAADVPLLARGGRGDPQYGHRFPFPPVRVNRTVSDGERLHLGDLTITARLTPGHTPGNTSWTWTSCEDTRCLHMVVVGSLSAPGYQLIANPKYPDIAKDFEHGFSAVEALPCDIALAPHPGMVDFWERVAQREQGVADALIDPALCRAYAKDARADFADELTKQGRSTSKEKQQRPRSAQRPQ